MDFYFQFIAFCYIVGAVQGDLVRAFLGTNITLTWNETKESETAEGSVVIQFNNTNVGVKEVCTFVFYETKPGDTANICFYDDHKYSFTKVGLGMEDAGEYYASTRNKAIGQVMIVFVWGEPRKATIKQRDEQYECEVVSTSQPLQNRPSMEYTWYLNGKMHEHRKTIRHESIVQNTSDKSAELTCTGKERNSSYASANSTSFTVKPLFPPDVVEPRPDHRQEVDRFGNVTITCSARCNPGCTYKWLNHQSNVVSKVPSLFLSNVTDDDVQGGYYCLASNSLGQQWRNVTIIVLNNIATSTGSVKAPTSISNVDKSASQNGSIAGYVVTSIAFSLIIVAIIGLILFLYKKKVLVICGDPRAKQLVNHGRSMSSLSDLGERVYKCPDRKKFHPTGIPLYFNENCDFNTPTNLVLENCQRGDSDNIYQKCGSLRSARDTWTSQDQTVMIENDVYDMTDSSEFDDDNWESSQPDDNMYENTTDRQEWEQTQSVPSIDAIKSAGPYSVVVPKGHRKGSDGGKKSHDLPNGDATGNERTFKVI